MYEKIIIKKNFLNLIKGDIISISTDSDRRIYFSVENRTQKVRLYGNEKGKWGKDNPYKKGLSEFMIIDEPVGYKTVIEFGYIPPMEPHQTDKMRFADDSLDTNDWINKILDDLKTVGVI